MARGGYRPGGGRPKSAANFVRQAAASLQKTATAHKRTPLQYMLDTLNDDNAAPDRRDRMAIAAAPFCHAKLADNRVGKKDREASAALAAASGSFRTPAAPGEEDAEWGDDLTSDEPVN